MDSVFFWVSKLVWLVLSPDSLLLILLLMAWWIVRHGTKRLAIWLLGFVAVCLSMTAMFPVGEWLIHPLETRFTANPVLPEDVDGIIVLGGAELNRASFQWRQPELNEAAERHFALLSLARHYPDAKLVYSGGSGSLLHQEYKGAEVAKMLYQEQGLSLSRVTFERNSRNTYENAKYSMEQVRPLPGETWVLVTTAWHMPRSVGVFCKAGWPTIPYPVDHRTLPQDVVRLEWKLAEHLVLLNYAVREWMGLIAYYASGKTTAIMPGRCDEHR